MKTEERRKEIRETEEYREGYLDGLESGYKRALSISATKRICRGVAIGLIGAGLTLAAQYVSERENYSNFKRF